MTRARKVKRWLIGLVSALAVGAVCVAGHGNIVGLCARGLFMGPYLFVVGVVLLPLHLGGFYRIVGIEGGHRSLDRLALLTK